MSDREWEQLHCPACRATAFSWRYRKARRRFLWWTAKPARVEITCGVCTYVWDVRPGTIRAKPLPAGPFLTGNNGWAP